MPLHQRTQNFTNRRSSTPKRLFEDIWRLMLTLNRICWCLLVSEGVFQCLMLSGDGSRGKAQQMLYIWCHLMNGWGLKSNLQKQEHVLQSTSSCFYNWKTMYIQTPKVTSHNLVLQSKSSCILQGASVGCHQTYFYMNLFILRSQNRPLNPNQGY